MDGWMDIGSRILDWQKVWTRVTSVGPQVAIQLGRQESSRRLEYLRADLEASRFTSPMFDTRRWVKEFEKACRMLWETAAPQVGSGSNVVLSDLVPPT